MSTQTKKRKTSPRDTGTHNTETQVHSTLDAQETACQNAKETVGPDARETEDTRRTPRMAGEVDANKIETHAAGDTPILKETHVPGGADVSKEMAQLTTTVEEAMSALRDARAIIRHMIGRFSDLHMDREDVAEYLNRNGYCLECTLHFESCTCCPSCKQSEDSCTCDDPEDSCDEELSEDKAD